MSRQPDSEEDGHTTEDRSETEKDTGTQERDRGPGKGAMPVRL